MPVNDFLVLWLVTFACIAACRILPALVLRGCSLSPRVVEALGYIPSAAFAALIANDLVFPAAFSSGMWPALLPWVASAGVVAVARKTNSMLWCCVAGAVFYVLLTLL